ncbi:hypothetical protein ACMHRJ_001531 [Campylobacter jejuni]
MLKPRTGIFGGLYFNQDNIFMAIAIFLVLHFAILALIFPFLKAFSYEIARVTKQKYFIYAFNTCFFRASYFDYRHRLGVFASKFGFLDFSVGQI